MKKTIIRMLTITIMILFMAGCSHGHGPLPPSKTFVLVHGAWQAPYVWEAVKEQLIAEGQKVVLVELPAHGDDNTFPANVSIDVYRDKVIDAMKDIKGQVIGTGTKLQSIW